MRTVEFAGLLVFHIGDALHLVAGTAHAAAGGRNFLFWHGHGWNSEIIDKGAASGSPELMAAYSDRSTPKPEDSQAFDVEARKKWHRTRNSPRNARRIAPDAGRGFSGYPLDRIR